MVANIGMRAAQTVARQGAQNAQKIGKTIISTAKAAEPMMNKTSKYLKSNSDIKSGSNDAAKQMRADMSNKDIKLTSALTNTATAFVKGAAPPAVIMGGMALNAAFTVANQTNGGATSETTSSDQPPPKTPKFTASSNQQTTSAMLQELKLKAQLLNSPEPTTTTTPASIADTTLSRFLK